MVVTKNNNNNDFDDGVGGDHGDNEHPEIPTRQGEEWDNDFVREKMLSDQILRRMQWLKVQLYNTIIIFQKRERMQIHRQIDKLK